MIHVLVSARKMHTFEEYLGHWGRDVSERLRLHRYEDLPDRSSFPRGTWLFSDLDEQPLALLRLAESLRDTFVDQGVRVLNDPRAVLRRGELLVALHARGLNDFRALGVDEDLTGIRFPVFVRRASEHTGPLSPLLHTRRELDQWIARALVTGAPREDLLVVEFLDTADAAGQYRKFAAFIVGGRILPRSLNRSTHWMVKHGTTDFTPEFQREELAFLENNPHRAALEEVVSLAGVEYGRVDYSVLHGRVQTWEINLCPTIGRGARPGTTSMPDESRELRRRAKQCFYAGFAAAWQGVDTADDGRPPITAPFTREQRGAARAALARRARPGRWSLLRTVLRPVKPVLRPVVERTMMLLVAARRGAASRAR